MGLYGGERGLFLRASILNKARANRLLTAFTWVAFALTPVYFALVLEYFNFRVFSVLQRFLAERPGAFLFSLLLLYGLYLAFFALTRRMWGAALILGALSMPAAVVNYVKYALTGDYFYPRDLVMAGDVGAVAGFASLRLPAVETLLLAVAALVVLWFCLLGKRFPAAVKRRVTLPVSGVMCAALVLFFSGGARAGRVFERFGVYYESASLPASAYRENGFTAAFALGIAQYGIAKPEGYTEATLRDALSAYPAAAPDGPRPDIVLVLSESFWDPRQLPGSVFSENPLPNYDRLARSPRGLSGGLLVPAMGGGTVRTEFEVLTGYSIDALPGGVVPYSVMRRDMPSYVSRYRDIGYDTVALHTYTAKFYNRNAAFPLLGFDAFWGEDELKAIPGVAPVVSGRDLSDATFADYVQHFLTERDGARPLFLFGITMEGHQPYTDKYAALDITAENPLLSPGDAERLRHFTQGVKNADASLGALAAFIDARERPCVLVWFGDHLPSIGVDHSAYFDTGYVAAVWTEADRRKLHTAPFLLYANFDLDGGLLHRGADNELSAYNLLNAVAQATGGGRDAYMGLLTAIHRENPAYNARLDVEPSAALKALRDIQFYKTYEELTKR